MSKLFLILLVVLSPLVCLADFKIDCNDGFHGRFKVAETKQSYQVEVFTEGLSHFSQFLEELSKGVDAAKDFFNPKITVLWSYAADMLKHPREYPFVTLLANDLIVNGKFEHPTLRVTLTDTKTGAQFQDPDNDRSFFETLEVNEVRADGPKPHHMKYFKLGLGGNNYYALVTSGFEEGKEYCQF